jgi:hypothetical protein
MASAMDFWLHPMAAAVFAGYCQPMKNKKHFLATNKAGLVVLGAVLLAVLTDGVGNAYGQSVVVTIPRPVVVVPAVVVQNDYVYYPSYGVYYNSSLHQYHYLRGDVWVTQPAPEGVSVDVLLASPSVNMDFHDTPERHHAEMVLKYPKNWKHAEAKERKEERKEERKDAAQDHDKK